MEEHSSYKAANPIGKMSMTQKERKKKMPLKLNWQCCTSGILRLFSSFLDPPLGPTRFTSLHTFHFTRFTRPKLSTQTECNVFLPFVVNYCPAGCHSPQINNSLAISFYFLFYLFQFCHFLGRESFSVIYHIISTVSVRKSRFGFSFSVKQLKRNWIHAFLN